jgi:hypothetical protein
MNLFIHKQKGFTLLFAILVSTLVISIGATIISIAIRQTILSSTSRESQFAFYAANTGLECAFYFDTLPLPFEEPGVVFPLEGELPLLDTSILNCASGNISTGDGFNDPYGFSGQGWQQSANQTIFKISIQDTSSGGIINIGSAQTCAEVQIEKTLDEVTGLVTTRISSKGYNTCDLSNPRTVERGIELEYQS